jgi:hypothetical protein
MEEWKEIQDYPNYSVSSFGNVRNDKTGKILKGCPDKDGYNYVCLYHPQKNHRIHQLVASAFIENISNYNQVDHIDKKVVNNNVTNLRWVSHSQNQINRSRFKNAKNKYLGVSYHKLYNKWRTRISVNNKRISLGSYATEEEGALAYNKYILDNNLQEFYNLNII